jgi:hypothetical protein
MPVEKRVVRVSSYFLAAIALCGGALHLCLRLPSAASIQPCPLPADALLAKDVGAGAYTDCYALDVAGAFHKLYSRVLLDGARARLVQVNR